MSCILVAPGTTFCPDTPENRAHFQRLCANLDKGPQTDPLARQIASENKRLKALARFLPGHEPDR